MSCDFHYLDFIVISLSPYAYSVAKLNRLSKATVSLRQVNVPDHQTFIFGDKGEVCANVFAVCLAQKNHLNQ